MQEITITSDMAKLFSYVLKFYINNEDKWFADLDTLWSGAFGIKNKFINLDFKDGDISEPEMEKAYEEVDAEIRSWDNRLGDWRFKRFYLNQYLHHLRHQLREVQDALAA